MAKEKNRKNSKVTVICLLFLALTTAIYCIIAYKQKYGSKDPVEFTTYNGLYSVTVPYGYRDAGGTLSQGAILELADSENNKKMLIMPCPSDYFEGVNEFADYTRRIYLDELYGSVGYDFISSDQMNIMGGEAYRFEIKLHYDPAVTCWLYFAKGSDGYLEIQIWTLAEAKDTVAAEADTIVKSLKALSPASD